MANEETVVRRRSRRVDTQPSAARYERLSAALGATSEDRQAAFLELVKLIEEVAHRDVDSHEDELHAPT